MTAPSPRPSGILALAGLFAAFVGSPVTAGSIEDHGVRGWTIATQLRSQRHVIGRGPREDEFPGPTFLQVANMSSTTGPALAVFLQSYHERMPSLRLDRDEMNAVIDYILSFKGARAARP